MCKSRGTVPLLPYEPLCLRRINEYRIELAFSYIFNDLIEEAV